MEQVLCQLMRYRKKKQMYAKQLTETDLLLCLQTVENKTASVVFENKCKWGLIEWDKHYNCDTFK